MQEFISGKQLIKIDEYWGASRKYQYGWMYPYSGQTYLAETKLENPDWNLQIPIVKTLPDNSKLVFHKNSKFPRHKLGLTTFKRKIKEKGADYIVGNIETVTVHNSTRYEWAYETNDTIFITQLQTLDVSSAERDLKIDLTGAKIHRDFRIYSVNKEQLFYLDYIQGKHTLPVIKDVDLNAIVDNKQERISVEELSTVIEMVKSKDKENINLALKLFAQFNLSADPLAAWTFLSIYHLNFVGISSVLYTNLKEQFKPIRGCWYMTLLNVYRNKQPKDDHERELIDRLLKDYLISDRLSVKTLLEFKNLGYNIEIDGL